MEHERAPVPTPSVISDKLLPVNEPSKAVFLSYASQDGNAARRICEAMRSSGIEVWFDQSELRGGDAWDQKIRQQIRSCALFMPVISTNTTLRPEGYFRLEWTIADQRTQMIARNRAFIVPVCVDGSSEGTADLPESFHRVQWTRLPAGETPPAFCERVSHLLCDASTLPASPAPALAPSAKLPPAKSHRVAIIATALVLCALAVVFGIRYFGQEAAIPSAPLVPPPAQSAAAAFAPPPHSVAVLPFVNMSADKDQEYFSDGLSEELLDSLAKIHALQVAARTSSFSFKGEKVDVADIGRKLNVAAVLEGSVRRDGNRVRITAQLINAVTGFHLWSETYDRDLKNVLSLQSEIASQVTWALQATLLPGAAASIELGGTKNPEALDAFLRGRNLERETVCRDTVLARMAEFRRASEIDPQFAKAFAGDASAAVQFRANYAGDRDGEAYSQRARAAARKALELAPELGESHGAMAVVLERIELDFAGAMREYQRAIELSPNNVEVLLRAGSFYASQGQHERALFTLRRALTLDPLSHNSWGQVAYFAREANDRVESTKDNNRALALSPADARDLALRGMLALDEGDARRAIADCGSPKPDWFSRLCLVFAYDKLNRRAEADAQIAALQSEQGRNVSYQMAQIYANRGENLKALDWLETAYRAHDSGLVSLMDDPLFVALRKEPRFVAIQRKLYPTK